MKNLVLLIDDEEIIRLTSGEILEELGFDVITAGSGDSGLEIFNTRHNEISLVILDMTLPDRSGQDIFNEMKKISSNARFLLTSGYRQDMSGAGSEDAFIQKPYSMSELNNKIKKLLAQ